MKNHYYGSVKVWVLFVVVLAIIGGAFMFGRTSLNNADNAVLTAGEELSEKNLALLKKKGMGAVQDHGTEMIQKGGALIDEHKDQVADVVKDAAQNVTEKAAVEGKNAVGEALQDVGEKLVADSLPGTYEAYTPEKVSTYGGAILDFAAPWCPSCRALEKNILAHKKDIPSGIAILKLDYDTENALRKKYGVVQQHTLVQVDADGNLIKKWVGSPTLAHILDNVVQ